MNCKEARELLQKVADYANVPALARAAEMGVQALELAERRSGRYGDLVAKLRDTKSESKRQMLDDAADAIESLKEELEDERYRHDRCVDYAVKRDSMFDRLMEDMKEVCRSGEPCEVCRHGKEPLICESEDYMCDTCPHEACVCHACRGCDRFEWRGLPEVKHEGN